MRKLASLKVVQEVTPIEKADSLELVRVGGWKCVAKIDEFKPGDVAVYFEVDSLLPLDNPLFAFLAGRNEYTVEEKQYSRLRTMKMRGQLSQGLAVPLASFPFAEELSDLIADEVLDLGITNTFIKFGQDALDKFDLTEKLGILKYEKPSKGEFVGTKTGASNPFPHFIPKTDQERVQNINLNFALQGLTFEETMKMEGSSITVWVNDDGVGVASRNLTVQEPLFFIPEPDNSFTRAVVLHKVDVKLLAYKARTGRNIALQGELMGPGIQGNIEQFEDLNIFFFDVFDIATGKYLLPSDRREVIAELGLTHVPVLDTLVAFPVDVSVDEILFLAEGPSVVAKQREGVVFKSNEYNRYGEVFSFKAINNKYLLKSE
ncbi:RNA ligase [Pseudomonas phage vB_PseuGesM_254]|uniref:RNA ligase n=1 Tax=Pseudomonas phage vB_PseuGesM_254 TaxID=3092638 RepID=A0AAX4G6J6_9CAUD|nr:RNA ligase [Pseudomonas phage PseuGes_254]